MFKDSSEGTTHFQEDGCGEPAHNTIRDEESWEKDFKSKFVHKGEDGDDPPQKWAWTIMSSFPIEVMAFIRNLLSEARDKEWKADFDKRLFKSIQDDDVLREEGRKEERERWLNQPANEHDEKIREAERDRIEKLIIAEILICHHENTPTSRLTSLINKIHLK